MSMTSLHKSKASVKDLPPLKHAPEKYRKRWLQKAEKTLKSEIFLNPYHPFRKRYHEEYNEGNMYTRFEGSYF